MDSSVISACDEHTLERLTELAWREGPGYYCPTCGKHKWPALHGEAAYDRALIDDAQQRAEGTARQWWGD